MFLYESDRDPPIIMENNRKDDWYHWHQSARSEVLGEVYGTGGRAMSWSPFREYSIQNQRSVTTRVLFHFLLEISSPPKHSTSWFAVILVPFREAFGLDSTIVSESTLILRRYFFRLRYFACGCWFFFSELQIVWSSQIKFFSALDPIPYLGYIFVRSYVFTIVFR